MTPKRMLRAVEVQAAFAILAHSLTINRVIGIGASNAGLLAAINSFFLMALSCLDFLILHHELLLPLLAII